jgi:hypothetical protein
MIETDEVFVCSGGVYYVMGKSGRVEIDPVEELTQMSRQIGELRRQLAEDHLVSKAEIERLTDIKRTCQCSEEDQCLFARERDEWRGQCNYWRRKYGEAQDELVDLAARAAGGE